MLNSSYADFPCPRCGSKQRIAKTWKEKVKTFSGIVEVDCSQLVCTNEECQKQFEKNLREDQKKKKTRDLEKVERENARKARFSLQKRISAKQKKSI